jgi:hypothetical protein
MRTQFAVGPLVWAVVLTLILAPSAATAFLVPNGDFEADNGEATLRPTSWFTGGPTSYILDDDSDGVGSRSVQITGNFGDWRSSAVQVVPGTSIQWLLDYKFLEGASGEFRADLRFFSGFNPLDGGTSGAFRGEDAPIVASSTTGNWLSTGWRNVVVPAGANFADLRISTGFFGAGVTGGLRLDNATIVPEPAAGALLAVGAASMRRRRR